MRATSTRRCSAWPASVQGNSFAKSAVETALLDAQGQRLGLPVHALLGGAYRDALPVLWTLASGDAARDVDEAHALIEARRHRVFKLKIGSHELAADIAHVQAIRRGLGDDVMLTVDVNQAWDEATAVRGIAALEAAGVALIEQPISRRNRRGLARLAARFDVAIMADEAVHDATDAFDLAADGAADVYALKISQAGGLWPTLRAAAVADAAGIGIYGGTLLEGSVGSIAAAHVFAACPQLAWGTELFGPLLLKDDVVVQRPAYRDFELQSAAGPGPRRSARRRQARLLPPRPRVADGRRHRLRPAMLFHVQMTVRLPHDMPAAQADELKAREKAIAQELQRAGTWRHLWRIAGRYANMSVFDVPDNAALHDTLMGCRSSPTWTSRCGRCAAMPRRSTTTTAEPDPPGDIP